MIRYLVSLENEHIVGMALEESLVPYDDYIDITNVHTPDCAPEFWLIENGEIKIDQQKLIEFSRKTMPRLTPIEFDLKLAEFQLYNDVQNLIANNLQLKIAYTRATFFSRTDPFIDQARIALNLTDEQVDEMWEQALTL